MVSPCQVTSGNVTDHILWAGLGQGEHTTPILCQLHWLPVCFQSQFKMLVLLTHKAPKRERTLDSCKRNYPKPSLRIFRASKQKQISGPFDLSFEKEAVGLGGRGQAALEALGSYRSEMP